MTLKKYERLFRDAGNEHKIVFEATPRYLRSTTAIPGILAYADNPQFIIMIRDPVDLVYSYYKQRRFDRHEDQTDFETAWRLQERRLYRGKVPKHCPDPQLLLYGPACKLGEQLQRLLSVVSPERIYLIRLESMRVNPQYEYQRVLRFLSLEDDGRQEFPVVNQAKEHRFSWFAQSIAFGNHFLNRIGVHTRLGITKALDKGLSREHSRVSLPNTLRNELVEYFSEDQRLLESLIRECRLLEAIR